jgi:hypothetical protein
MIGGETLSLESLFHSGQLPHPAQRIEFSPGNIQKSRYCAGINLVNNHYWFFEGIGIIKLALSTYPKLLFAVSCTTLIVILPERRKIIREQDQSCQDCKGLQRLQMITQEPTKSLQINHYGSLWPTASLWLILE